MTVSVIHTGWDGRSMPVYEQRAECGCGWTLDGSARLHGCVTAILGRCTEVPLDESHPAVVAARAAWSVASANRGAVVPAPEYTELARFLIEAHDAADNGHLLLLARNVGGGYIVRRTFAIGGGFDSVPFDAFDAALMVALDRLGWLAAMLDGSSEGQAFALEADQAANGLPIHGVGGRP